MAIKQILTLGNPLLHEPAKPVDNVPSMALEQLIDDLLDTMQHLNGIGIAAPQIGVSLQVAIIGFEQSSRYPNQPSIPIQALINPVITPIGDETELMWEGCLSVPGLRGVVARYKKIHYTALTPSGDKIDRTVEGMHARIVQHECDHLAGIVYTQRIADLRLLGYEENVWEYVSQGIIPSLDKSPS